MEKDFGNNLKQLRQQHNLTQAKLGEILKFKGQTISYWELGKREPDICTLIHIAKFFEVSLDELCGNGG